MDAIPVEQMSIAMLIRLVQMMLHIVQDQNTTIEALRRQVQNLVTQVYQMRSELAQLRAGIVPGLDAGSEAVEEGPQNPDAILRSLEVTYQLPYIDIPTIRKTAQALDAKKVHELDLRGFHLKASGRRTHQIEVKLERFCNDPELTGQGTFDCPALLSPDLLRMVASTIKEYPTISSLLALITTEEVKHKEDDPAHTLVYEANTLEDHLQLD
ncbi:hypothetical protein LZL87_008366 [Fusarium oxysporum]|nr:hypothetical protein LZL87_008366 [Fusarium oxysporum]